MESTWHIRLILDPSPRSNLHCSVLGCLYLEVEKKCHFRNILIACDTIYHTGVKGPAGRRVWPDPYLEPEMHARCRVCRVWHGRPASAMLPWRGHSGANAALYAV